MIEAIWLLVIGAILLFLGWSKKAGGYNKPATWVGILLILVGAFWPAYGVWSDSFSFDTFTPVSGSELNVEIENGSYAGVTNAAVVTVTDNVPMIQFNCVATAKLYQNYSCINFTVKPVAKTGTDNTQLVQVVYSAPERLTYESDDVFYSSGDEYTCDWYYKINSGTQVDGTKASGSVNVLYTDTLELSLRMRWKNGADSIAANFNTVGETTSIPITINGVTYNLNCVVITSV